MYTVFPSLSLSLATRTVLCCVLALFNFISSTAQTSTAAMVTLADGNSTFSINTNAQATGFDWIVEGVDHLKELSNWYCIGNMPEASVNTLTVGPEVLSDTNSSGSFDQVMVPYSDSTGRFEMEIDYRVAGGTPGSGFSSIDEEIRITNIQNTPLAFQFFEYIDLDLDESPFDDTVEVFTPNRIRQFDSRTYSEWSFDADRFEVDFAPVTLNKLLDGAPSNLSDKAVNWPAGAGPIGPGNVTFALQWDFIGTTGPRTHILPGETVIIHKEGFCQIQVPEPSSWMLAFALAMPLIGRCRSGFLKSCS